MAIQRDKGVRETWVTSAARTTSGNAEATAETEAGYSSAESLVVQLNVTAASGTTPTLNVVVEDSVDGGTTWNAVLTFTQKTGVIRDVMRVATPFTDRLRVSWTIGGGTPSFTFAVDVYVQ